MTAPASPRPNAPTGAAAALALLGLVLATPSAQAQVMTPGLWEQTIVIGVGGKEHNPMAEMQARLAQLPPERRKQAEAMMAQAGMAAAPGAPQATRVCVTPEQAQRGEPPPQGNNCRQTAFSRSGNTTSFKFECAGPPPSSGEGSFTYEGAKAYNGTVKTRTMRQGQPIEGEMKMSGRWVAADCGNVKPPMSAAPGAPAPTPRAPAK